MRKVITTDEAPEAIGPYSQAVQADGLVFTSGQIPLDPKTGAVVQGGIEAQTRQVLDNLESVLKAAQSGLSDVVQANVYLVSLGDFEAVNKIYAERFGEESPPARICVEVSRLPKDSLVEISAVAVRTAGR